MQIIFICDIEPSSALEALPGKYAFKSPSACTDFALEQLLKFEKSKAAKRQVISDSGGFNSTDVEKFSKTNIKAFISCMEVHKKLILHTTREETQDTFQITIDKTYLM